MRGQQQLVESVMAFEDARVHSQLCTSLSPTWAFAAENIGQRLSGSLEGYFSSENSFFGPPSVQSWTSSYVNSSWQREDGSEGESAEDFNDEFEEGMAELVAQLALGEDDDEDDGGNETGDNSETDDSSTAFTSDSSKVDSISTCSESCSSQSSPTLANEGSSAWESVDKFISSDVPPLQTTVQYTVDEGYARIASLNLAHQQMLMQNLLQSDMGGRSLTKEGRQAILERIQALQMQTLMLADPRLAKVEKKMPSVVFHKDQQGGKSGRRGKKDSRRGASSDAARQDKKNSTKSGGNRNNHHRARNGKSSSSQGKGRNGDKQWASGPGGNSGLVAVFLKAGGGAATESTGTGVFLPRNFGGSSDARKKPANSTTVLLPERLYDALKLRENPHITRPPLTVPIATAPRVVHADKMSTTPSVTARGVASVIVKAPTPPKVVYRENHKSHTPVVCHTLYSAETDSNRLPTEWSY